MYLEYEFSIGDFTLNSEQYEQIINRLESFKPKRICEFGSGESTKIFKKYCDDNDCSLSSIESDEEYGADGAIIMPLVENTSVDVKGSVYCSCNKYDGFEKWLEKQDKFDFVLIDGPIGYGWRENYTFSRVQLLSFVLLDKIADDAYVFFHDSNRKNANKTLYEFERLLIENGFSFKKHDDGEKRSMVEYEITRRFSDIEGNMAVDYVGHYDYLIVGCGLYGLTCARILTNNGFSCLVIDNRDHLGGNCHTSDYNGVDIHDYGIHHFHTSDDDVWSFVNKYARFNEQELKVCATDGNDVYSLPFNMYTFNKIVGVNTTDELKGYLDKNKIDNPRNLEEFAIGSVGKEVYEKLIKGYTEKQWGKECDELPCDIIKRLPLRYSYDNSYFNDKYQGVPIGGYTRMCENILLGRNADGKYFEGSIEYKLNVDFLENKEYWLGIADRVIYCGSVDELLGYELGELDYRSLRFEHTYYEYDGTNGQGCPLLNNTDANVEYTRSIDHVRIDKNKALEHRGSTVLTYEYPVKWRIGLERYYPNGSDELYARYVELLKERYPSIVLGGRLGLYKYLDMDDTIRCAIDYCDGRHKTSRFDKYVGEFCNIWVIGTNDGDVNLPNHRYYKKFITSDIIEPKQNINSINRFLCEYVAMWYVWKNNIYSDYVGFCHYRRIIQRGDLMFYGLNDHSIQHFHIKYLGANNKKKHWNKDIDYSFIDKRRYEYWPNALVDDCIEYLRTQDVIPQGPLKEYTAYNEGKVTNYYNREIYLCKWNVFCELMTFINGYIEFIKKKYNVSSYNDWIRHISEDVIQYQKKRSISSIKKLGDKCNDLYYQDRDAFLRIYDKDEGLNGLCNCWRYHAYMIEVLISTFIGTHEHISNNVTVD